MILKAVLFAMMAAYLVFAYHAMAVSEQDIVICMNSGGAPDGLSTEYLYNWCEYQLSR